jgi:endonuclease I
MDDAEVPLDGVDAGDENPGEHDPWADWDPDPRCAALEGLKSDELRRTIHGLVDEHTALSYDQARYTMFSFLDNVGGEVQCVYTGEWVVTDEIPSADVMNTEHTWCQSWGSDTMPARSDLHHLFPTLSYVNSTRSNRPFGVVEEASWSEGGSQLGRDSDGRLVFEPRDRHKGDCARALFYVAVRYEMEIYDYQEDVLREWNRRDLPDDKEGRRNDDIETVQEKRNPFVDCPEAVDRILDF